MQLDIIKKKGLRSHVHRNNEPVLPNPKFVTRVPVRFLNINQKNIQSSTELPDHHKVTFSFNYNFDFPFIECEKPFKVNWAQLNINYWVSVCTNRGLINWTNHSSKRHVQNRGVFASAPSGFGTVRSSSKCGW